MKARSFSLPQLIAYAKRKGKKSFRYKMIASYLEQVEQVGKLTFELTMIRAEMWAKDEERRARTKRRATPKRSEGT